MSASKTKIFAPVAVGLLIGYVYKGYSGKLMETTKQYDFKADATGSLNQALGIKTTTTTKANNH
jgi:hypothetical protein